MSSKSEQSSATTNVRRSSTRGFQEKCVCGLEARIYTSKTQENPGRPFFRCPTKREDHLFKWVEDAVYEEVVDVLPKLGDVTFEICKAKSELQEMKNVIEALKDDLSISKHEIQRCKTLIKCCVVFFSVIIIIIILVCSL